MSGLSSRPAGSALLVVLALTGLSTLVASVSRPSSGLLPGRAAYVRGLAFLETNQRETGEFPTYYWFTNAPGKTEYVSTVFTTAQILYSLGVAPPTPGSPVTERAIAYLLAQKEPPGIWRYYGKAGAHILSPDVDDTSVAWAALRAHGHAVDPDALVALTGSRNAAGLFNTWIGDPATWVGVDSRDVDLVVNLNALLLFALAGRSVDAVCRRAVDAAITGVFVHGTIYYRSPLAFTYALSRAYADGGAHCLDEAISSAQEAARRSQGADGAWGDDLETALGVLTLLNGGYRGPAVDRGIRAVIARQAADGGWARVSAYRGAVLPVHYGSRALTTALCLEALGKYLRRPEDPRTSTDPVRPLPGTSVAPTEPPSNSAHLGRFPPAGS